MKISCPTCSAKYSITDDKIQDRLAKIRCRKCGTTIVIDGKTSPPHVYASAGDEPMAGGGAAGASGSAEYSVDFGEGDQRTLGVEDIVQLYNAGQITGDTYVWADGFDDWKALAEVPELVDALNAAAGAPSAPAPSPWSPEPAQAAAPAPSPAPVPVAVARPQAARTARGPAADLFGGIHAAGSEEDVATSAPAQPVQSEAAAGGSTGARNESSVLFSLSALTSAAQNSRPQAGASGGAAGASREDSGLIDLKALTAAATKAETAAAPAASPLASFGAPPLGVAAPLGMPAAASPGIGGFSGADDMGMMQPKSKAPMLIGGGLAIGLLAVAAAILLKPEPPPPPPPAPVAMPAPTPTPTPTPAATDPAPPATGTEEEPEASADSKAKPAPKRVYRPKAKPKTGGGTSTSSPSEPAKAAPKKSSGCGCGAGDLQCAMRCAAKGG